METTQRLNITFPGEFEDPFFDNFKAFANGVDSWLSASVSDRNIVIRGGGDISFDRVTGTLVWNQEFEIWQLVTGFKTTVSAGSAVVNEGESLVVDAPRTMSSNSIAAASVVGDTGFSQGLVAICFRQNNRVYFRNGNVVVGSVGRYALEGERRPISIAFAGASQKNIPLSPAMPDALYKVVGIVAVGSAAPPSIPYVSNKTVSGFDIILSGAYAGAFDLEVVR